MAALPSSVEDISTNAKPRERPVSRSSITFTDSTVPACENNCCKSSLEVWNERLPTYSFIDILCVPFPAFRSEKRSFEPGVLRRNGNERRNERSNAQWSNFYGLTTNLPSNHPNAELSLARAHPSSCARVEIAGDYDAFVADRVADHLVSHVFLLSFSYMSVAARTCRSSTCTLKPGSR